MPKITNHGGPSNSDVATDPEVLDSVVEQLDTPPSGNVPEAGPVDTDQGDSETEGDTAQPEAESDAGQADEAQPAAKEDTPPAARRRAGRRG